MDHNAPIPKPTEDYITITELLAICRANYVWFIVSLALTIGLALFYLKITPNTYTRQAAVLVNQETRGKSTSKDNNEFNDLGLVQPSANINNVQRHLGSLDVLMEVVRRLNLAKEDSVLKKAQAIKQNLKVDIEDDKSTIINLKYQDSSVKKADDILYAIVQVYNDKSIEKKLLMTRNTSDFIDKRLDVLQSELGIIDDSISTFKSRHQITDLDRVSDIHLQQQSQSEAQILTLSNQKEVARYIRDILNDKTRQFLPANSGVGSQVVEAQISQYNTLLMQLNEHLTYTSTQNPLIANYEKELADLRHNILTAVENQIKSLDIQLNSLRGYNDKAESKIASNPEQAKRLASVERQQKVKESLFLYLLQKKEENEMSMRYTTQATQLIDQPNGSSSPTSPNKRNILLSAIVLGLFIPVVILFIRKSMDTVVRSRADVERKTNIPIIGEIPFDRRTLRRRSLAFWRKRKTQPQIIVQPNSRDVVNEAFRFIRYNLDFMSKSSESGNVHLVTSGYAGSGKTFVAMNLAVAISLNNKRVLLIDGDLRHAAASKFFGVTSQGLSDYLSNNDADTYDLITQHPKYFNLDILGVGALPPNPTELLSSPRFGEMIQQLRAEYDYIFIDCPPANAFADTGILEQYADRTLYIIRQGLYERSRLTELHNEYRSGRYKHLSLILNNSAENPETGNYYNPNN